MTNPPDNPQALLQAALEGTEATRVAAISLREQIEEASAARERDKKQYLVTLFTILAVLLIVAGAGTWYGFDLHQRGTSAAADREAQAKATASVKHLVAQIEDCLNPGGVCATRQAKQTADLVKPTGPIGSLIVYGLACQKGHEGDNDAILACVQRKLATRENR